MAQRPVGVEAGQDVLEEGVVGAALRRRAQEVAAPLVTAPGLAVPFLDRVRRVGEDHVELAQAVALDEAGVGERVAADDLEVLDAVEEQVHPGDGRGDEVELLPVEPERAVLAAGALHLGQRRDQHAAGAAGGVVDRLAGLRLEHLRHQVDEGAVGVELLRRVAAVVGELLDQVLVAVAELVLGHVGERERLGREVLDEVLQRLVGQTLLVGPRRVAEDAVERSGLAASMARKAFWMAAPTFFGAVARRSSARLRGSESGGSRRTAA